MAHRIKVAAFLVVWLIVITFGINAFLSAIEIVGAYAQRVGG